MNTNKPNMKRWVFSSQLAALALLLGACNVLPQPEADMVRNFTLSGPVTEARDGANVRPVQLAGHLRGRAMAVRIAPNEVIYDENVRWAEPLDDAITQRLRASVGGAGAGKTVTVQIQRCELLRHEQNNVQLAATYAITARDGTIKRGTFTATSRAWDGRDPGALVAHIRDAVDELGAALAAAVAQ